MPKKAKKSTITPIEDRLKEYLNMDHELSYGEFSAYYDDILTELNANYGNYTENELLTMRYICNTVAVNAQNWSFRKDKNAKKYKKINDKMRFWSDAITYKLKKELGYDDEKINDFEEKYDESVRPDLQAEAEAGDDVTEEAAE